MKKYTLTVSNLAEFFSVSNRTVYTWMETKELPFVRLGGSLRFNQEDIEEWIKAQNETKGEKK